MRPRSRASFGVDEPRGGRPPIRTLHGIPHDGIKTVSIRGFSCRATEAFYRSRRLPPRAGWADVAGVALRKLDMLDYAVDLRDLASPPGNRLEALRGDLAGLHSIRVNQRWRLVFRWTPAGPVDVEIRDYH